MREFDASSIVHAWDNYPIQQFPPLWEWLQGKFSTGEFHICDVALQEVGHVSPECEAWLKAVVQEILPITEAILQESLRISGILGIIEDEYHPKGVDENDIIIISSAALNEHTLISNEAVQNDLPQNVKQYKVPAVCNLIGSECFDFVTLLRVESPVFG